MGHEMANPLKKLAGETAIYGLSTILARVINFAFVPFYTRMLSTASYGTVTEFLAYIAVLQVMLVMGLETGCFNFANREGANPNKVYSSALAAVFGVSAAFLAAILVFAEPIAHMLGYDGYACCVKYMGGILALDSVTAILFARLRQEHKALKFAIFKTIKILVETGANIYLFFGPKPQWMFRFISPTPDFAYVIFAIFISCVVCGLLFLPTLLKMSFEFDGKLLRQMLLYSLPLMVAGLPGILNDFIDRILFRFLDTNPDAWQSSLGIFQAAVKLSVIMSLFIQMFRFAAEPFFFQRAKDRNSKVLYAQVMEWFTAFCAVVLLGVVLYIDVISLLLGRDFRSGVGVVPLMLMSYMLLGMLFNVSMWYKLSGKTNVAIWITLSGLVVTILVNVIFMPRYSYWAAAAGHFLSYLVMFIISASLGQRYYPIPYNWGRICAYVFMMLATLGASYALDAAIFGDAAFASGAAAYKMAAKLGTHTVLICLYIAAAWLLLRRNRIADE